MNKKGFTLIELLGVITILAIIATLTSFSVVGVTKMIKQSMWENKITLIENGAERYGEENNYSLRQNDDSGNIKKCSFTIDGVTEGHDYCATVSVQYLIDRGYVTTDDLRDDKKVIINNTNDEIVNDTSVYVWIDKNIVYAEYVY